MKFCEYPFRYAYLNTRGRVWPCPWMNFEIGNVYENDLSEIWQSEAAQRARKSILDGSYAFCRKTSCRFLERDDLPDLSDEEIQELAVAGDVPRHINIANDYICNIACTTCRLSVYHPETDEREKIDGVLERLLPYANQTEILEMNGNGEFLANPSFINLLNRLEPEKENFCLDFETNGVLFDEAHWEMFAHLSKYRIQVNVTVNSLRRETYRYMSGGFDHVDKVRKNLRFLSDLRRENKIDQLVVVMVVQESNFWEIPEYIQILTNSDEFAVDQITMRPVYRWFGMEDETYWFKNILNPMHPYHKEYQKILADDCWKDPKVYDWGCHNIREAIPHPLKQEEIYRKTLSKIYNNEFGLSPVEYIKKCIDKLGAKRIGFYGKNEFSLEFAKLLKEAGVEVFQLTWAVEDCCASEFPKVAKQEFKPDMADAMIIIDFFKGEYWFKDLRALGFEGSILTVEEFIAKS